MPHSSHEGKDFTVQHMLQIRPDTILDVGAGSGTYARLLRPVLGWHPTFHAVEVWEPYVSQFSLSAHYSAVVVADAINYVEWLANNRVRYSAVILGDVLEHMTKEQAQELWADANRVADEIVVASLPIVRYPQGHEHGNPYEEHVKDDWSHDEVMESFPGITDSWQGSEIGVYVARVW